MTEDPRVMLAGYFAVGALAFWLGAEAFHRGEELRAPVPLDRAWVESDATAKANFEAWSAAHNRPEIRETVFFHGYELRFTDAAVGGTVTCQPVTYRSRRSHRLLYLCCRTRTYRPYGDGCGQDPEGDVSVHRD